MSAAPRTAPQRRRSAGGARRRKPAPGWLRALLARIDSRRTRAATSRARQKLRRSVDQWAQQASARATRPSIGLVGLDVSSPPSRLRGSSWLPVVAAAVVGALFLAVLRMDVIKLRLALAQSYEQELALEEEQRELTVAMRRLRDPADLARRAEQLGFARAERLIDLDAGTPLGPQPADGAEPADESKRPVELAAARRGVRP